MRAFTVWQPHAPRALCWFLWCLGTGWCGQLFVNGEFIGGCDIVTQLYQSKELSDVLPKRQPKAK